MRNRRRIGVGVEHEQKPAPVDVSHGHLDLRRKVLNHRRDVGGWEHRLDEPFDERVRQICAGVTTATKTPSLLSLPFIDKPTRRLETGHIQRRFG